MKKTPIVPELNTLLIPKVTSNTSDSKAVLGSSQNLLMVNNEVVLTEGIWQVNGYISGTNNGTAPDYILMSGTFSYSNGSDSGASVNNIPPSEVIGATAQVVGQQTKPTDYFANNNLSQSLAPVYIRVPAGETRTVYLVPFLQANAPTNARVIAIIWAARIGIDWEIL